MTVGTTECSSRVGVAHEAFFLYDNEQRFSDLCFCVAWFGTPALTQQIQCEALER